MSKLFCPLCKNEITSDKAALSKYASLNTLPRCDHCKTNVVAHPDDGWQFEGDEFKK